MALITQTRWEARRWNAAGIERLDGVPTAVLDCWGVRLRKRWLSAALNAGRSVADGYEFDLSTKARLRWLHRPVDRLGFDWLEGGVLKEQIVLDSLAGVPDPAVFDVLVELPPGVTLHYQPALTQEEIDQGAVRPAPVVGSYAVFDGAGAKLGHIFRPFAETALGQRRWLDLTLSPHALGVVLRIVLDRGVLEALPPAAWPVVIDPTLGYTSIGASTVGVNQDNESAVGSFTSGAAGTMDNVRTYGSNSVPATMGVYADSSTYPGALVGDSAGGNTVAGNWTIQNVSGSIAASTPYWVAFAGGTSPFNMRYDSAALTWKYKGKAYSAGNLSDPFPAGAGQNSNYKLTLYATYTETAAVKPWILGNRSRIYGGGVA